MKTHKHFLFVLLALLVAWSVSVAQPARAEVTDNYRSQFSYILFDAYHGEELLVVTEFHGVMKQTANQDGSFTTDFRVNAHGRAVGLTSGAEYIFNDTVRNVKTTTSSVFTETLLQRSRLTNPDTDENMILLYEIGYHVEGGVVTIDYFNQSID
jgi:hypothetical protein